MRTLLKECLSWCPIQRDPYLRLQWFYDMIKLMETWFIGFFKHSISDWPWGIYLLPLSQSDDWLNHSGLITKLSFVCLGLGWAWLQKAANLGDGLYLHSILYFHEWNFNYMHWYKHKQEFCMTFNTFGDQTGPSLSNPSAFVYLLLPVYNALFPYTFFSTWNSFSAV